MGNLFKVLNPEMKGGERIMKKAGLFLLVACLVLVAAVAFAGIANTKHNLTSTGGQTTRTTDSTATLCGFCHIPHGGDTSVTGLPLWARQTPAGPYTVYGASGSGLNGQTLSGTPVNSMPGTFSLTCLSCHDGTISLGTIVKNGVSTTYPMIGNVDANGKLVDDGNATAYNPLISTDLRNDHPVGLEYRGEAATYAGLINAVNGVVANKYPLYGASSDQLECASCHDPHREDTTGQTKFLRGANATLCQDCHANK